MRSFKRARFRYFRGVEIPALNFVTVQVPPGWGGRGRTDARTAAVAADSYGHLPGPDGSDWLPPRTLPAVTRRAHAIGRLGGSDRARDLLRRYAPVTATHRRADGQCNRSNIAHNGTPRDSRAVHTDRSLLAAVAAATLSATFADHPSRWRH